MSQAYTADTPFRLAVSWLRLSFAFFEAEGFSHTGHGRFLGHGCEAEPVGSRGAVTYGRGTVPLRDTDPWCCRSLALPLCVMKKILDYSDYLDYLVLCGWRFLRLVCMTQGVLRCRFPRGPHGESARSVSLGKKKHLVLLCTTPLEYKSQLERQLWGLGDMENKTWRFSSFNAANGDCHVCTKVILLQFEMPRACLQNVIH